VHGAARSVHAAKVAALCIIHHLTCGSMGGGHLLLELGPNDLDELASPSGSDAEPDTLHHPH
jgi:hypothetical protein